MPRMRIYAALLLGVSVSSLACAEQNACMVAVTVVKAISPPLPPANTLVGKKFILPPLYGPVSDLRPGAFVARERHRSVPIVSVEAARGPRRIVLLVEGVPAWAQAVEAILLNARSEDSFALVTFGGARLALPFGSSRRAIRAALEAPFPPVRAWPRGNEVVDALLEAAALFGSPETGDSIILFGPPLVHTSRRRISQAQWTLTSRGIRLFHLGGGFTTGDGGFWKDPLTNLCERTGGGWEFLGYAGPEKPDETARLWRTEAEELYEMATTFYVVRLDRMGPHVTIDLSSQGRDRAPWATVYYPRPLPVCPPPVVVAAPAAGRKKR
jgi:hypothetical protein